MTTVQDLSLNSHMTPEFNPVLRPGDCDGEYDDGRIFAEVDTLEVDRVRIIRICSWSSRIQGQGHTVEALKWFRSQGFNKIIANGVGLIEDGIPDKSTSYWLHMHSKGLVDVLLDDDSSNITPLIP